MKKKRLSEICVSICILILFSCNKLTPSGFWHNFAPEHIVSTYSNQGPWGGKRKITWQMDAPFSTTDFVDFAQTNNWQFVDSFTLSRPQLETLDIKNDYSNHILKTYAIKDAAFDTLLVFRFKTGWKAIEPGNISDTELNGFVVIDKDKKTVFVYHLWGE